MRIRTFFAFLFTVLLTTPAFAQAETQASPKAIASHDESSDRNFEQALKKTDDVLWFAT
jgi:hypothetical protein